MPSSDLTPSLLYNLSHIQLQSIIDYCATDKAGAQYYEVRDVNCMPHFRQLRLLSLSFYLPLSLFAARHNMLFVF